MLQVFPSNLPIQQANTQRTIANNSTFTKTKAFLVTFPGTYRFRSTVASPATTQAFAQIYRNGVAVGETHQASANGAVNTYIEDISGWQRGDTAELWVHGAGAAGGTTNAFAIMGNYNNSGLPVPAGAIVTDANT